MYKTISVLNLTIDLVKATKEVETAPSFHFITPCCKDKPISKKFCGKHGEIKPIKEMLVEVPEDKNIEVVGISGLPNPMELKNFYYVIPTALKRGKLSKVNRSGKLYASLYALLDREQMSIVVKTWFNSVEHQAVIYALKGYLMFSVLTDLKEKPLVELDEAGAGEMTFVESVLKPMLANKVEIPCATQQ